jgi:GR25 family glycosyltransferase involved in LPS biosynthesis
MGILTIVIGDPVKLRNKALIRLEDSTHGISFVKPVYLVDESRLHEKYDDEIAHLTLGRSMLLAEVGCALAHRGAIKEACAKFLLNSNLEWCLILEDDANISPQDFLRIKAQLIGLNQNGAAIVNFARDPIITRFWKNGRPRLLKMPYRASLAFCYAVNRSAANAITPSLNAPVACVADWPPYFEKVKSWSSSLGISDVGAASTIGLRGRQKLSFRTKLIFIQLLHLGRLARFYNLNRLQVLFSLVLKPLTRDALNVLVSCFPDSESIRKNKHPV